MKSLSLYTKLYLFMTYISGAVVLFWHIRYTDISHPVLILTLCVLASLSLILKVEGTTDRSHYSFNFLVYGFTFSILGTTEAILVILVSNIVEWIWNKPPWFIQLFNTACYMIVMQVSGLAYHLINPVQAFNTWQAVLGILFAMVTFNVLNHLLVGIVIWLARGENFKKSGIFDFFPFMLDLALLTFGASISFVWQYNVFALIFFLVPLYLLYSTLRVPALERKTEIDSKTGLFNHAYFQKQFTNELMRANRFDRPLTVIMADLDLLRNINNTYGHLAGDEVLTGIAHAMKKAVREYDMVCRFGGEEFAVLLQETTLAQAFERAEVIRKAVESMEFTVATSVTPIRATLSLGIAQRENFSQNEDEIIHNADLALYHSKLNGRNRCFAFSNDSYVDFAERISEDTSMPTSTPVLVKGIDAFVLQKANLDAEETLPVKEIISGEAAEPVENVPSEVNRTTRRGQKHSANIFIGGLALLSLLAFSALASWANVFTSIQNLDWLSVAVICALIGLSEVFSVDLYIKNTSVSTSAIPILMAYLLFGGIGVVMASSVLAISLLMKFRSPFSRFIFNLSNHILAGSLIAGLLLLVGEPFHLLSPVYQVAVSVISALILYIITTWMVSFGMGLNLGQSPTDIWSEQFKWLAPYYMGIGLITYTMIFGYVHDHVMGLLLMVIPMVLLRLSQKQYIERTRAAVAELREKNQLLKKNSEEINEINQSLLEILSEIIDLRDPYVLGHSKQVCKYAMEIARNLGLNEKQIDLVRRAGLLHDIGKLGISMEILTKPSKLTPEEYELIKDHAALGGDLVKRAPSLRPVGTIIRQHHEFYNGKGYPDQLAGNQILIESRIIAVADAIEAMISDRPYRRALPVVKIVDELIRCSTTQFDPLVVDAAVQLLQKQIQNGRFSTSKVSPLVDLNQKMQYS